MQLFVSVSKPIVAWVIEEKWGYDLETVLNSTFQLVTINDFYNFNPISVSGITKMFID